MGTYGSYGNLCALWGPMGLMGTFVGDLWDPLGTYGILWHPMGTYGIIWGSMGVPDSREAISSQIST